MRAFIICAALGGLMAVPLSATAAGPQYDQFGWPKAHVPRAAPWFLYWPYDAYFNAPAPTGATFYPPHMTPGNFGQPLYFGGVYPGGDYAGFYGPGYGYGPGAFPMHHHPFGFIHHPR